MGRLIEVMLVRELTDPRDIAKRTGGILHRRHRVPWIIEYDMADILWAGHPNKPVDVSEAVPFLYVREPRRYGTSFCTDGVILTPTRMLVVSPSFTSETTISGYSFAGGRFLPFDIRIDSNPWGAVLRDIRDLAREEARQYPAVPRPQRARRGHVPVTI